MENESYYADEDLRLSTLAEAMKMSSHQLSELINVHFQMSFIQFINHHRIKIACNMLEVEDRNILSIAYAVGFNSKSAFNRVFKELLGNSPSKYRKNPVFFEKEKSILLKKIEPKL
jgi:AraC-like DNA-binding protein